MNGNGAATPTTQRSWGVNPTQLQLQLIFFVTIMRSFAEQQIAKMVRYNQYHSYRAGTISDILSNHLVLTPRQMESFLQEYPLSIDQRETLFQQTETGAYRVTIYGAEVFRLLALLHDCGKPENPARRRIYCKTGSLTPEERATQSTHVDDSVRIILAQSTHDDIAHSPWNILIKFLVDGAQDHHEKHDGTGYPNKKCGNGISWAGRWMRVVDVFEARTGKRPYDREPKTPLEVIQDMANSDEFDPAFFNLLAITMQDPTQRELLALE